ncbi:SPASM domain-containing protein [Chitinophaga oryzae]|uniref:SPASM domain-containing protein n=1 Tax=Chitinophaga oryzae TaxID=2725414 RepID=A0ABX6LQY4_9BACT|nr:radical SAM protein [Chitinophaga oryzae]QJB42428.1 SPASM domain-containing protein [Chitinophaga oryzae]
MKFKLSKYVYISKDPDLLPLHAILYVTRTGIAIEVLNTHLELLLAGNYEQLPLTHLKNFIRHEILVPEEEDELATILSFNKVRVKDRRTLSFTIQPSANCQLGCNYCGQSHSKHVMNENTADLMVNRIREAVEAKSGQIKTLSVTWYGGEPITGLSSIEYNSRKLMEIAAAHNLEYTADIITNALALREDLFQKLVTEYKIMDYQITIDGTAAYHDKRRMLKNGTASFDIIFNNVVSIAHSAFYQQSQARINIRCNVDAENKDNVMDLLKMMKEADILNKVGFYISPIHDWGDNGASTVHGISKEDFAQFEIEVFLALQEYGALDHKVLLPKRSTYTCMVVDESAEVFDAYGNISTCWDVPYTTSYFNTPFVSGNLRQPEKVDTSNALMRQWYDEIPHNDTWCKKCTFLPVCGGGCPKEWHFGTPACPSFKFNMDERLFMRKMLAADKAGTE